ncbi:MAG: lipocalin family protein [Bacteroidota bacterium]
MKKSVIFVTLLIISIYKIEAQTLNEYVVGNWKFHRAEMNKKIDSIGKKMIVEFFGDMSVNITSDNNYQLFMMKKTQEGNWRIENDKLILKSTKGIEQFFILNTKIKDSLKFEMKPNEFLVLKREFQTKTQTELKTENIKSVVAKKSQLLKKWYLKKRIVPNKSDKELEMISELLKNSYFNFHNDGKYEIEFFSIYDSGKWTFNNDNTEIIQEKSDKTKVYWKILKITSDELILNKGDLQEQFLFSTNID